MNLHLAQNVVHRHLISGRPLSSAPRFVRQALKVCDRHKQAKENRNEPEQFRLALDVYDELLAAGEAFKRRAAARKALANYIDDTVLREHYDLKLMRVADRLRNARDKFCYGMRADGSTVIAWDNKSGLARLDPDEAREESQRLGERYGAHVLTLATAGRGLHFLVLTIPNVDVGDLAAAQKKLYRKWVNFKRIQRDKDKAFPEILGDIAIMESPLAADGRWNVHLNVLIVTERPFHAGLYERIRREWHFNCHMRPVKGDAGEIARAFKELLKYSARAVPEKSQAKASRHASDAPAMTNWPAARFVEWFNAQQGFKRTRTYGCLYGSKVPKPEPHSIDDVIWLGYGSLSAEYFGLAGPLLNLIPGDNLTTRRDIVHATGPP